MINTPMKGENLQFGMPILHAWISCNLDFKHWQARKIQFGLRQKLGIYVDKVKQGGCGNTNDGNTGNFLKYTKS